MQSDIIGLLDSLSNKIAIYEYDSWGKITSIKDVNNQEITDQTHIAHINPFRYRSYYYDKETSLYYLNSRYYNPEWSRFINADGIMGANEDVTSYNLYAYVSNNPINMKDSVGEFAIALPFVGPLAGIVGGLVTAVKASGILGSIFSFASIISAANETVKTKPASKPKQTNNHTVYTLNTKTTNTVMYVGRTTNVKVRKYIHSRNSYKKDLKFVEVKPNLTYPQARGLEQVLIEEYKTINKLNPAQNQIRGIRWNHPNIGEYMALGRSLLENETYVGGE